MVRESSNGMEPEFTAGRGIGETDCLCWFHLIPFALTARGLVNFLVGARPTNTSGSWPGKYYHQPIRSPHRKVRCFIFGCC